METRTYAYEYILDKLTWLAYYTCIILVVIVDVSAKRTITLWTHENMLLISLTVEIPEHLDTGTSTEVRMHYSFGSRTVVRKRKKLSNKYIIDKSRVYFYLSR